MTTIMKNKFHWADYIVFTLVLIISSFIGLYYAFIGRKSTSSEDYLMAGRKMQVIPIALSLLASFMSAIVMIGVPAEVYKFGFMYWFSCIAFTLVMPIAAHVFLPVFFKLKVTTVFEYLELRFSKVLRFSCAIIFSVQMILYMSIVLYAPSLALNQVTGLNTWVSVFSVGIVCTFYTTIGGMKAVIWTDSFQIIAMFAGAIAIVCRGVIDFGGISNIWEINKVGGRLDFLDFDPNPMKRDSFWTFCIGGTISWLAIHGVNQAQIQRALCVKKLKEAQIAMWITLFGLIALMTTCCLCGLVIYAQYADCDPLKMGIAGTTEQLVPLYVMDRLGSFKGLPGLFTASVFSASLSTLSSGLNSLSAVLLQDILGVTCIKEISERKKTFLAKIFVLVYGAVCIALTFVVAQLGDVVMSALSFFGILGGPVLAVFILGMLYPCINKHGALAGLLCSLIITLWCGMGAQINKSISKTLTMNISGCDLELQNITNITPVLNIHNNSNYKRQGFNHFYDLSYQYYGVLACITCTIIGLIVSFVTGFTKGEDLDEKLIISISDLICCFYPKKVFQNSSNYFSMQKKQDEHGENNTAVTYKYSMTIKREIK